MNCSLIIGLVAYFVLGVCYAIDFFHNEYEEKVEDEGMSVGEFFGLTIFTGVIWPIFIVMFAIMDLRDER